MVEVSEAHHQAHGTRMNRYISLVQSQSTYMQSHGPNRHPRFQRVASKLPGYSRQHGKCTLQQHSTDLVVVRVANDALSGVGVPVSILHVHTPNLSAGQPGTRGLQVCM